MLIAKRLVHGTDRKPERKLRLFFNSNQEKELKKVE